MVTAPVRNVGRLRRATIEVPLFAKTFSESGLIISKSSEFFQSCVAIVFAVCLNKPWDCSSGGNFIFLLVQFLGEA